MSQHDFTIDNQTFPSTRSDINSALQALASLSSGASSPSTTFAYQLWVNTTSDPNILNIRNSANNAWIEIGEVNQASASFILTTYAYLQAGAAANPSFSFDDDRDTGMYRAAANMIGFATNGTEVMRIDSSGVVTGTAGNLMLVSGTSASVTGSSITFTSIPSWVKRITVMVQGVSFASSSGQARIRIGTGGVLSTTTYTSDSISVTGSNTCNTSSFTNGLAIFNGNTSSDTLWGVTTITNLTGNTWISTFTSCRSDNASSRTGTGYITLGGALDIVGIVATAGTFDAGTINIMYE